MVGFGNQSRFCTIIYGNGMGYNTSANSLYQAAANAINWAEVECRHFGTARLLPDNEILSISVGIGGGEKYRVRVGRVKAWIRQSKDSGAKGETRTR